ncbi:MAG: hypothetical protein FWD23_00240 [Oscillospiraceae bacterium]|nr:hypothetical protein [Oscillospiraceae bacterium]
MLYNKRIPVLAAGILTIAAFMFFAVCGCAQNSAGADDNYEDILNEAAYSQAKSAPEVITGTISPADAQKAENETAAPETAAAAKAPEATEIAEFAKESAEKEEKEEEVLFVVTQSGKKYHLPGCYMVKSIKQYLTREEAEQSKYEPCKICKPQ